MISTGSEQDLIEGVRVKRLKVIPDERGRLMEILRSDDDLYLNFGQVYLTAAYPRVVKAWHYHKLQYDNIAVVKGMTKIALYDSREGSGSYGQVAEFFAGEHNPLLIQIPPEVYHGFKCISESEALIINIPTQTYNYADPDEYRLDPYDNTIPYNWRRKDG